MEKTKLAQNYPGQLSFYSDADNNENAETASEILSELEMRLNTFLFERFGKLADEKVMEKFTIEQLMALPQGEKSKFEDLIQDIIAHRAFWEYCGSARGI